MKWMEQELAAIQDASLERELRVSVPSAERPGYVLRGGKELLNLSSNDYLGLARHPAIIEAMRESLLTEGAGAGASRHITGHSPSCAELERKLAEWQQCEAALVFASGYMANAGVIGALAGRGDVVFSDRYNHASIVDGIAISRAEHARYRHNDMDQLGALLHKHRNKRRKLIVTDAVFSMDGDRARLQELAALKREYGAMLMVDEAHSGGMYGKHGEGLCAELDIAHDVDVHIGTFSKAFGLYGAYACGTSTMIRWLVSRARTLMYSTALPPAVIAGIARSLELVKAEHWRRERVWATSQSFRSALIQAGFRLAEGDSHIVPVIVGSNEAAISFSGALEEEGIAAIAIRPPTVPDGMARIRFSLSAWHTPEETEAAAEKICQVGIRLGVISP